ncbi:MAG TPA: glycosyltransferase family 2 protein [Candidatus Obscuribacter sp.]|nr:glycosyltransferase family 2 protein [Candidatus Obscuribacter sp.]
MTTVPSTINVMPPVTETGSRTSSSLQYNANVAQSKTRIPEISVVIPVFNEEDNIALLYDKLVSALDALGRSWEAVLIDDGSTDSSFNKLAEIAGADERIKVVRFVKNFGQTAALAAGIDHARGDVIIPMDADLQNDPADVRRLLDKLDEGYDVVSGWRKERKDELFLRLIPSWTANRIISLISGVRLHDYGCSLKAYRKEVIKDVRLYGEMHRFVPIYATWQGAKVSEIPVNHQARQYGQSKYGISRTFKVVLDLMTVKFMSTYFTKPIYLFGTAGLWSMVLSFMAFAWMVTLKFFYHTSFIETPLPVLVAMFFMVGMQLILMGLQSEILMRTYHESQGKRIYIVKSSINVEGELD